MARTKNVLLHDMQGAFGKYMVLRTRNGKTFISKYPDMSGVKQTTKQKKETGRFAKAVEFAQSIVRDPAKKAAYKVKEGQLVYHAAIQEYLKAHK